jgi:peptide/nickel transport system permease protein
MRHRSALRLLCRRLLQLVPLLLGVVVVNFCLIHAAPGSLLDIMTAENQVTDPALIERLRTTFGMDDPLWLQLLKYIASVAQLDLGFSYRQNMPVADAILAHLPATVILMTASLSLAVVVGVVAGLVAAIRVNTIWDTLVCVLAVLFFATPSFWLGIMLTVLFAVKLGWLPVGDMETIGASGTLLAHALDVLRHLLLPAVSLGLFYAAIYARVMRASMLEVFRLDFVRTARAKGLTALRVNVFHVFRNALLPVVTLLGLQMGTLLAGSVVIETVFAWPGIGTLLFDAVSNRDYPIVLGVMVLGSLMVVVANVTIDMLYLWLDPRIEFA